MIELSDAACNRISDKLFRNLKSNLSPQRVMRLAGLMRDMLIKAHELGHKGGFSDLDFAHYLVPESLGSEEYEKLVLTWIEDAKYFLHVNQEEVKKIKSKTGKNR